MAYYAHDFCELAIRKLSEWDWVRLMCLQATADFYGWSEVFPTIDDAKREDYAGRKRYFGHPRGYRGHRGTRLRICRSKTSTTGYPGKLTNAFRVTNNARNNDLIAIAQAVKVDYGWMEAKYGERRKKAEWDAIDLPDSYCHLDLRAADC